MLADRLAEAVRDEHAVGAVAGMVHNGVCEYAAAGMAAPGRPMTAQTPVRIASITKPILTMAVLNEFRTEPDALDAPLREFLSDLEPVRRLPEGITLRRALSHTSGLREADEATLARFGEGDEALDDAIRLESALGMRWRPGAAWAYCNSGFRFAGAILARRRGTTFERAMHDLVLGPAGMADSGFEIPPGAATGHRQGVPRPDDYARARRPGGGLWSTAKDLMSFAAYAMDDSAFLAQSRRQTSPSAFGHRYGLGWFLNTAGDVIFHFGDIDRFRGLLAVAPDHGVAAVAVGNDENGGALSRRVVFGEITRLTGLRRPRPHPVRVVSGMVRQVAAKVLA